MGINQTGPSDNVFTRTTQPRGAASCLLIGNYPPDGQPSMDRFAALLFDGLSRRGVQVKLIKPRKILCIGDPHRGLGKWLGYLDKFILFPFALAAQWSKYDVIHIVDHSNAIYLLTACAKTRQKTLVTCNDLLAIRASLGEFKEQKVSMTGTLLQKFILAGLRKCGNFVCISDATRKDLDRLHGGKIAVNVVYMPVGEAFRPTEETHAKNVMANSGISITGKFFINVGKNNWYKNRPGLLRIFKNLVRMGPFKDHRLVLAGGPLDEKTRRLAVELGVSGRVLETGKVGDEVLAALYGLSCGLIFPSVAEGFGWPIIEAQACGCPVFTSNRAPMTEAGGDAAVYFDPEKPDEAARIIAETLADPAKIEEMRRKGFENIKRFSTDKMIDEYLRVYEEILERSRAHRAGSRPQAAGHRPQAA